jgi:hypothetical protein
MSALELSQELGKEKLLTIDGFRVGVTVLDAKRAYGNTRFQVAVIDGEGTAWVDSTRLQDREES